MGSTKQAAPSAKKTNLCSTLCGMALQSPLPQSSCHSPAPLTHSCMVSGIMHSLTTCRVSLLPVAHDLTKNDDEGVPTLLPASAVILGTVVWSKTSHFGGSGSLTLSVLEVIAMMSSCHRKHLQVWGGEVRGEDGMNGMTQGSTLVNKMLPWAYLLTMLHMWVLWTGFWKNTIRLGKMHH